MLPPATLWRQLDMKIQLQTEHAVPYYTFVNQQSRTPANASHDFTERDPDHCSQVQIVQIKHDYKY